MKKALIKMKIATIVNLHQEGIQIIANGHPGDPIDKRSFNKCFTPPKIRQH